MGKESFMNHHKPGKIKNLLFKLSIKAPIAAILVILLVIAAFWLMNRFWGFSIFQ
jgi:hypothetical protein